MTRYLLLLSLLLLHCLPGAARQQFVRNYWLTESNTPVRVNTLLQGPDKSIWLGTDEGLFRFNGNSFVHITDSVQQPVTALAVRGKDVYAGYKNGKVGTVTRHQTVALMPIAGRRPGTGITAMLATDCGLFLATEGEGVFAVILGRGDVLNTDRGLSDNYVYDIHFLLDYSRGGDPVPVGLIAATDKGVNVLRVRNGKLENTVVSSAPKNGLADNIVRVLNRVGRSNHFWAGLQEYGYNRLVIDTGGSCRVLGNDFPWIYGQINDILSRSMDAAWIATDKGLISCDGYEPDVLLPDKKINKVLLDRSGNLWCATNEGLTRISEPYAYYTRVPLVLRAVTAMACGDDQRLWYTQNRELWQMSLGSSGTSSKVLDAPELITSLYADRDGSLWVGTLGKGLWYRSPAGAFRPVRDVADSFRNMHILSIARIRDHVWISTLNGVMELTVREDAEPMVQQIREHRKRDGVGSDYVYQLYPDSKGHMWMATDGAGVCRYDGASYQHWDSTSGFSGKVVYSLTEDASGHIWAGTLEHGLLEYDGRRWRHYGRKQGLQDINISTVMANKTGQVIVVHATGVDEWFPEGRQFRHYGRRLGVDLDSVSGALNCAARDAAGNVYIPFEHGVITFRNIREPFNIEPSVAISDISLFFKQIGQGRVTFDHDENHLSFRYNGVNLTNPERLHYRYMLEGYNDDWVYTNDEEIAFPQLPPGDYRFRVQASLSNTFEDALHDSYAFRVRKPVWQEWWFLALASMATAAGVYYLLKIREESIKKVSLLQKERMVAEYEQLKSQVNPHFLFNSLNTLVSLIEDDREKAVDYTVNLSDLYRNMLSFRNLDAITLGEEWEILQKYLFIQQSRFGKALQLESQIAPELMHSRKVVPLALQMLVENAIKHNVVSRAHPLIIHIRADEQWLEVRHVYRPKVSEEKGAGISMINISSRYALLTKKSLEYGIKGNEYIVILPLL